jgi:hypothetical protein
MLHLDVVTDFDRIETVSKAASGCLEPVSYMAPHVSETGSLAVSQGIWATGAGL